MSAGPFRTAARPHPHRRFRPTARRGKSICRCGWSRQIDGAISDTLSAINAANAYLPAGLPYPPLIRKVNPADTPILVLGVTSDSLPLTVVDAYAQNILL